MSNTAKNYPGTAADEDIVEILTAISVVSRRLARNIAAVSQQSQTKEGGKQNEQNQVAFGCRRGYNLKNVHSAKLTESVVDGVTSFSYDTPKAIPGAVSLSLDAEGDSSPFYADGIVYFRTSSNNGYSGDLEIALIPEWFRTEILREKLDNKGVLVEKSDATETEKFALLFEFDGDVKAIRHVLYNCSASRPSIESKTKEDTIEPGTETLSLTADPRSDGLVKSRTGDTTDKATYDGWYQTVYIPDETEG